jgi:nucleoside-diphosphate-sugar epimerase
VYGDGEQARDFTYVDDVVEANMLALGHDGAAWGEVLNAAGGQEPTTVNELLRMITAQTDTDATPVHEPPRPGDIRRSHADVSRARRLLGYEPKVQIAVGLRRTVGWFAEHQYRNQRSP